MPTTAPEVVILDINYDAQEVAVTLAGEELLRSACDAAALVTKVETTDQNAFAVSVQRQLKDALDVWEKARTQGKAPVLEIGRLIDATVKEKTATTRTIHERVKALNTAYQTRLLDEARKREEEARAAIAKAEAERQAALSQATDMRDREIANAQFALATQAVAPAPPPPKIPGQTVKHDWEIEVSDPYLLLKMHPNAFNQARLIAAVDKLWVKDALNSGLKLAGITARKIVVQSTR